MMEPNSARSAPPKSPPPVPLAAASGQSSSTGHLSSGIRVPDSIRDTADSIREKIANTDITRINGYLRLANLVGAGILELTSFIALFRVHDYEQFLVYTYIMFLAAGLVFIENHDRFPRFAEKVKVNFGFMFTAPGRACYIVSIAFLAFSLGLVGILIGVAFLTLASINFFLIYKHPAYQAQMTHVDEMNDTEPMPQIKYFEVNDNINTFYCMVLLANKLIGVYPVNTSLHLIRTSSG